MTTEPHVHICPEEAFPVTLDCGCEFTMDDAECFEMRQCALHEAAPKLLEACKVTLEQLAKGIHPAWSPVPTQLMEAAIAKAKGEGVR